MSTEDKIEMLQNEINCLREDIRALNARVWFLGYVNMFTILSIMLSIVLGSIK